jgi:hypothetical protein
MNAHMLNRRTEYRPLRPPLDPPLSLKCTYNFLDPFVPGNAQVKVGLVHSFSGVCNSQNAAMLFSSAFSIAYFAMLRVSELAVKSSSDESGHALNNENVKLTKLQFRRAFSTETFQHFTYNEILCIICEIFNFVCVA